MAGEKINPFTGKVITLSLPWHQNKVNRYELRDGQIFDKVHDKPVNNDQLLKKLNEANNAAHITMREYYQIVEFLKDGHVPVACDRSMVESFLIRSESLTRDYEREIY